MCIYIVPSGGHHNDNTLRSDDHVSLVDSVHRHDGKIDDKTDENTNHHLNPIRFEHWIDQDYITKVSEWKTQQKMGSEFFVRFMKSVTIDICIINIRIMRVFIGY